MPRMQSEPTAVDAPVPAQAGLAMAALILGAICVPLSAYVGVQSLAVSLPVFGVWFIVPVVIVAMALGTFAARSHLGVAGAALGVAAFLLCMTFFLFDRLYGTDIRAQLRPPSQLRATQIDQATLEQLSRQLADPSSPQLPKPAPSTQP